MRGVNIDLSQTVVLEMQGTVDLSQTVGDARRRPKIELS